MSNIALCAAPHLRVMLCGTALLLLSCGERPPREPGAATDTGPPAAPAQADSVAEERATIHDASGRELGTLTIRGTESGIAISGALHGLPPGTHGIHLHDVGRCEAPFESAGNHWNPTNRQHGSQNPGGPHFGDLPNLTVTGDSSASVQATTPGGALRGVNALLDQDGAAVVIHAGPDDEKTDPSGNSGGRLACGVISGGA